MSDQNDVGGKSDPTTEPFLSFWRAYLQQADAATKQLLGSADLLAGPHPLSREQLAAASGAMDVYLRSPEFLDALRQYVETIVAAKKQLSKDSGQANGMWNRFVGAPAGSIRDDQECVTPHEVVYQEASLRLLRFRGEKPAVVAEPVLVCFSLVNRPYILDLQVDRSVVRQLLRQGLDVYLIDWGIPAEADQGLHLHDYVCGRMKNVADFICEYAASPQINLLGYCMGGTMCTMFTTLYQQQVRNLILLATPIDFGGEESLLNLWTRAEYFDVDALIDAFGNCPGSFLQMCFQQTKPVQNYVQKFMNLRQRSDDNAFLENFFALERWANDHIPIAGETFREFVKMLYQRNLLIRGQMTLDGLPIDLRRIRCPLLLITADLDHLVPPSSGLALTNLVSSTEVEAMHISAGHIGLAISARAHQHLWPQASAWIAQHSTMRG